MSADAADTLRRVIAASGLRTRRFAADVLTRDERSVRRWLAGPDVPSGSPIPAPVTRFLHAYETSRAVREAVAQLAAALAPFD